MSSFISLWKYCLESCQIHLRSTGEQEALFRIKLFRKDKQETIPPPPPLLCGWGPEGVHVCEIKVVPICGVVFLERRPVRCGNTPQISLTLWCTHCSAILLQSCIQERDGTCVCVCGGGIAALYTSLLQTLRFGLLSPLTSGHLCS